MNKKTVTVLLATGAVVTVILAREHIKMAALTLRDKVLENYFMGLDDPSEDEEEAEVDRLVKEGGVY